MMMNDVRLDHNRTVRRRHGHHGEWNVAASHCAWNLGEIFRKPVSRTLILVLPLPFATLASPTTVYNTTKVAQIIITM